MSSLGTSDSFLLPFGEFALESTAHAPKSEDSPRCRLRRGESGSRQEREEAQTCFPIVPDPRQHLLGSSPEETAFDQFRRHSAQSGTEFFWGDPFRDEVQVPAEPLAEWVLEPEFPPLVGRAEQPGEPQRRMRRSRRAASSVGARSTGAWRAGTMRVGSRPARSAACRICARRVAYRSGESIQFGYQPSAKRPASASMRGPCAPSQMGGRRPCGAARSKVPSGTR